MLQNGRVRPSTAQGNAFPRLHAASPASAAFVSRSGARALAAQYDGGAGDARKLTAILYINEGWREEDGGGLMMYDAGSFGPDGPSGRCWRRVTPRANRLVLFRSDRVLHHVAPTYATRYALTMFFACRYGKKGRESAGGPGVGAGAAGLGLLSR